MASSQPGDDRDDGFAQRNAAQFLEKYDKAECQELLAFASSHWMLSTEDFKLPTEPAGGLITSMGLITGFQFMVMMPVEEGLPPLDMREVHQIVRELTVGIYALNQVPNIALEANFDESTTCQLPPAYQDTRVGQILTNVDYMLKSLWHGAYFPKDKRTKFTERWRSNLDVNASGKPETKKPLLPEFTSAGMIDISKDADYEDAYSKLPVEQAGDTEMQEEKRFFMAHVDDLSMQMTFYQQSVEQFRNLFIIDADWLVSSIVRLTDSKVDNGAYERLNARLQLHEIMLKANLESKMEIRRQIHLLKLVSFLVPFLIGMRKRMKVPDLQKMLSHMTGDEVKTEREFPPLILGSDFRCKNFNFGSHYFNLHGGILIDQETNVPKNPHEDVIADYENIKAECADQVIKWLDPAAALQESYPIPIREYDGKQYYTFALDFETFYPQSPQKPRWVQVLCDEVNNLRYKRLPIQDLQIHEMFKKYFGYKRAIKYKNLPNGLKAAASRGLVAMFMTLCRKCPVSRLGKQDEVGLSLMHYGAIHNRPQIIATLILQSMDVNVRRSSNFFSQDGSTIRLNELDVAGIYQQPWRIERWTLQLKEKLDLWTSNGLRKGGVCIDTADSKLKAMETCVCVCMEAIEKGPTPLHLAARCGSLDAVTCLLSNYANVLATDEEGWAPIHHASYFDHEQVIKMMVRRNETLLELQTRNSLRSTPLLLAASAGALSAVRCLINLGAYVLRKDEDGNNVVHLAALRFHTNVLEFFIQWNHPDVPVWTLLVGMLQTGDIRKKDAAVKCLEVMSTSDPNHWKSILDADGVPALVNLLKIDSEDIQAVAASVLCNISEHDPIRKALTKASAGPILITLLCSHSDEIQSRAAIVLSDLACVDDNQSSLATQGVIAPLVNLLDSELEDVLVNAVNAVRVLCLNNSHNQSEVNKQGGIEPLVEFLTVNSDILQAAAAAAIAAISCEHTENQNAIVDEGAVEPLVSLIKGRNMTVQVKAASALEALAENNSSSQTAFMNLDAPKALIRLFTKVWSMEVKEQTACAVWALAGSTKTQQKYIAERITISHLMDMLLLASEKLQYVGCMGMTALGREDIDNQNRIAEQGGISPLVRLLRSQKTSQRVLLTVIRTLGVLCVGVAHRNNRVTQKRIAEERAMPSLVQLLVAPPSDEIRVEAAYTIGCLVLGNPENQEKLGEEPAFKYSMLLDLLTLPKEHLRLRAGLALTIFAFNNTPQQYAIREAGGVKFTCFNKFLDSEDETSQCYAAFQMVVLARVIVDKDQVTLTADGVTKLVEVLQSQDQNAIILSASLMSSLAHTRAGITDAMLTVGAVELLINQLYSENDQVRYTCAITLGYLTYNRAATRKLMTACRNTPGLYERLMDNIGVHPKICRDFTEEYLRQKTIGLPCLSLEVNGGPPVDQHSSKSVASTGRPRTTQSLSTRRSNVGSAVGERAVSAPAMIQRSRSAGSSRLKPLREPTFPKCRALPKDEKLPKKFGSKKDESGLFMTKLSSWSKSQNQTSTVPKL